MNEIISVRCIDDEVILSFNETVEFQCLTSKLVNLLNLYEENKLDKIDNLILDFGHRSINPSQMLEIFELIVKSKTIYIKGIRTNSKEIEEEIIYEETIRGGQIKFFDRPVLILKDINEDATVYALDNVYVVGSCKGKIIARNKNATIVAKKFQHCFIKIYTSSIKYIENLEGVMLDYNAGEVRVNYKKIKGA